MNNENDDAHEIDDIDFEPDDILKKVNFDPASGGRSVKEILELINPKGNRTISEDD